MGKYPYESTSGFKGKEITTILDYVFTFRPKGEEKSITNNKPKSIRKLKRIPCP